jgi:hypothetical protein
VRKALITIDEIGSQILIKIIAEALTHRNGSSPLISRILVDRNIYTTVFNC